MVSSSRRILYPAAAAFGLVLLCFGWYPFLMRWEACLGRRSPAASQYPSIELSRCLADILAHARDSASDRSNGLP